jgi:aspartate racemase
VVRWELVDGNSLRAINHGFGDSFGRASTAFAANLLHRAQSTRHVKTLGMIGGVGPESTIDYYQRIIALYRERNPDGSYPALIINSVNLEKGRAMVEAKDWPGLTRYLVEEIAKLAKAGADFGLIAANTPHIVFDDVARESAIPLISIVEATCVVAKATGSKRLGLFGTRYTMQANFFPRVFSRAAIELVTPEPKDQDYIHGKYFDELVHGTFLPETHAGLLAIVDRMKSRVAIDGVILAGTELPLILREPVHNGIPFLDTTKIHVEAAVSEILS